MALPSPPPFVPINVEQLRVGMYVKLDCHWLNHPFPRNHFRVQTTAELAVIRTLGDVSIYVDASRSDPDSLTQPLPVKADTAEQARSMPAPPPHAHEAEDAQSIIAKKQERIQAYLRCQEGLKKASANHTASLRQTKEVIDQVSAGREGCASTAIDLIGQVIDALHGEGTAMAMLNVNNTEDFGASNFAALHSLNVFMISMMIGQKFELSRKDMLSLGIGALLHDIGQRKIPSQVLAKRNKGMPLTRAEKTFFELHPEYGKRLVEDLGSFPPASAQVVYQHHERIDGSGSPCGLKDDSISFLAKIVMVADEYDRLTNTMDPRKRLCPTEAFSHIYVNRRKAFSENVIVCLIQSLSVYPPGTFVLLSDESPGMVISTNFASMTRPVIMIYELDVSMDNIVVVDLAEDKDLHIKRILRPTDLPVKVLEFWNPRRMAGYFFQVNDDRADSPNRS